MISVCNQSCDCCHYPLLFLENEEIISFLEDDAKLSHTAAI